MFSHFNPETIALLTGVQKDVLRELVPCNAPPVLKALVEVAIARAAACARCWPSQTSWAIRWGYLARGPEE